MACQNILIYTYWLEIGLRSSETLPLKHSSSLKQNIWCSKKTLVTCDQEIPRFPGAILLAGCNLSLSFGTKTSGRLKYSPVDCCEISSNLQSLIGSIMANLLMSGSVKKVVFYGACDDIHHGQHGEGNLDKSTYHDRKLCEVSVGEGLAMQTDWFI